MPEIKPFKGLIYNLSLPIQRLVAPPYDVISDRERDELYELHPYNVIRLILNRDENRYESAKNFFETWLRDGIITERDKEAIFVYEQGFKTSILYSTPRKSLFTLKLFQLDGMHGSINKPA